MEVSYKYFNFNSDQSFRPAHFVEEPSPYRASWKPHLSCCMKNIIDSHLYNTVLDAMVEYFINAHNVSCCSDKGAWPHKGNLSEASASIQSSAYKIIRSSTILLAFRLYLVFKWLCASIWPLETVSPISTLREMLQKNCILWSLPYQLEGWAIASHLPIRCGALSIL